MQKLAPHYVEKPWGRADLSPLFAAAGAGRQIGEVWFESADGRDLPLLVKYIFTSERLSIHVDGSKNWGLMVFWPDHSRQGVI
ncbi:hypothetical protein [Sphingobium yanoikuyae]|uniref:hypothetical protein n=1 Tax=Sphingobium yanoikuyae TaxID=13690 RepID=UPI0028AC412D|nr:hypothetical protein [Sphingobium yanoikuyae]